MTTEEIEGVYKKFTQVSSNDPIIQKTQAYALWEIALQLSILNSTRQASAIELESAPMSSVDMLSEPYRGEPFRGRVIEALFKSVPDGRVSTMSTETVIAEIMRLKKIEKRYQKLVVRV